MKKFIACVFAVALAVMGCFGFTACSKTSGEAQLKVIPVELSSEQYAFAIKKGDTTLKNSVNQFFKDKRTEIDEIFAKYTDENADLSSFGSDGIQTKSTDSANELVVATNLEFSPFEYTNGSKIAGIDMEIAQLLADYLGKKLVVENMQFDAVVNSVASRDEYDIGIAGLTITPERAESVDFSDPYFGASQMIVVAKDDTTFDGLTTKEAVAEKLASLTGNAAKCGGQKGTTSQFYIQGSEDFGFDGFANLTFSPYASAALAAQDMLNGGISFVVVDKETANVLVSSFVK